MGSIDENYRLMQGVKEMREIRTEYELLKTRYTILETAVQEHRQQIGVAYGIGSFKAQHAANMELWDHVKKESLLTKVAKKIRTAIGIPRPAMMEETE
jgi:hypothetical protein